MQTNTFIGVILFPAHSLLLASIDFSTADHITATLCIADGTGRLLCYDATMNGQIARTGFRYQDLYLLLRVLEIVRGAYQAAWDSATSDLLTAAGSVKTKFGIEANSRPVGLTKSDDGPPSDWDIFVGDSQAEELIEVKSGAISKADREVFWRRLRRELAQIEQRRAALWSPHW